MLQLSKWQGEVLNVHLFYKPASFLLGEMLEKCLFFYLNMYKAPCHCWLHDQSWPLSCCFSKEKYVLFSLCLLGAHWDARCISDIPQLRVNLIMPSVAASRGRCDFHSLGSTATCLLTEWVGCLILESRQFVLNLDELA